MQSIYSTLAIPYDAKIWQGKFLTNRHLENSDEKIFDEFHNGNAYMHLLKASVAGEIDGETARALITIVPCAKMLSGYTSVGCKCRLV